MEGVEVESPLVTFKYSRVDFALAVLGLLFFLSDIVLDVVAAVHFYLAGDWAYLGLLVVLLVGSSVLGQLFSWLWYRYDDYQTHTWTEGSVGKVGLKVLHLLQLGVYLRYAGVLEVAVRSFCSKKLKPGNLSVGLSNDLALLRLIETFSESAPQMVLMQTVLLQTGDWRKLWTVLKVLGSASAIACSVTWYHRSMRSFQPALSQQSFVSSLLYFAWNLLLIFPRLAALTLFAYSLPCYVIAHFLCWWAVLFFLAWYSKTSLMDSPVGEMLYQGTVALIWYFSWFNVAKGRTLFRCTLYHTWMLLDTGLLCGLACWQSSIGATALSLGTMATMSGCVGAVYVTGLLVKLLYYKFCHPTGGIAKEVEAEPAATAAVGDATEMCVLFRSMHPQEENVQKPENRRMKRLAQNFYS